MSELGFPVPPPPPDGTLPEPAAVGGVHYQRFPDPRSGTQTTVLPDMSEAGKKRRAVARPNRPAGGTGDRSAPAGEDGGDGRRSGPERAGGRARGDDVRGKSGRRAAGHRAPEAEEETVTEEAAVSDASSSGRHTVPDELVRASTYRLPADRVFRAKVRDSDLSDDPTTRLVPKPRES